ncbi:MAG: pantetheine-phosphate adenylyltransferase [Clostridium sp.]
MNTSSNDVRKAIYPGSFDPVTKGHADIIKRAAQSFDELTVAVLINPEKKYTFSIEERIELIKDVTCNLKNITVVNFQGLLVDFMRENNINTIVKGLRNSIDFEYELQMFNINKILGDNVETLFMMSSAENSHISSTVVREVCKLGGDIKGLVPNEIEDKIKKKFKG